VVTPGPHPRWWPGVWVAASGAIAFVVLLPVAALVMEAWPGSDDLWTHVVRYVLPAAAVDTLLLLAGVGVLAAAIGAGSAWLVTAYDFPLRRVWEWALLLPLAVPTYIIAYAYLDILHPVGPVQNALRNLLGYAGPREFRLPDVRSMTGCIVLLGFVLYPYVYLTARAMFTMQAANLVDVARTLGAGRRAVFLRVALPLSRPAIAVGLSLALMEALNDIGASEFLGVRTMTVSIYTTWVTRSDLPGAAQIALAVLVVILAIVWLERWGRRQRRYHNDAQHPRPLVRHRLRGAGAALAVAGVLVPVGVGFAIPAAYLTHAAVTRVARAGLPDAILTEALATVALSLLATALALAGGVVVAYAMRAGRSRAADLFAAAASLGYAVPGTVLAIGILPVVTGLDRWIDLAAVNLAGRSTGLLILGSGAAVVYAYVARFLALATGGVESGLSRVPGSLDDAARTLGHSAGSRLRLLHLPLIRPALAAAALLVFVDCMKELPATLLLRPIGLETLATHLYGEAVRGTYEDAAIAALLIVAVGLLPVIVLARMGPDRTLTRR
jgi:iron(III) transport system permease protein